MQTLIIFFATQLHIVIIGLALVSALFLTTNQKRLLLYTTLIAGPLSLLVARLISQLYYNPRPFVSDGVTALIQHVPDNGFPSDHSLLVFTIASLVFTQKKSYGIALYFLGFLVGIGRVLTGVHHMTDVVGSLVISIIATYAAYAVVTRYYKTP